MGARNPYALAEFIQGKKIDWMKKPYSEKISILEKAFDMPYGELFDSRMGSPLFENMDALEKKITVESSGVSTDIKFSEVGWTPSSGTSPLPAKFIDFSGSPYTVVPREIRDPVQGVLPNCWLVAALASIAWNKTASSSITQNQYAAPFNFRFYEESAALASPQATSAYLPVDTSDTLIYCRSNTPAELWPALYEKAYYQWREKIDNNTITDQPNYCNFGAGHPLNGIEHLTGLTIHSTNIAAINYDAENSFSKILNITSSYMGSLITRKITKPGVAWTYDPANIPASYNAAFGADPVYDTSTFPSRHCYSLLGTYGTSLQKPDQKYIVLRNPYGPPAGDPNLPGVLTNISFCGINLADSDGIFALSAEEFVKKFEGFGWGY